jgi:hypothetical protein
VHEDAHEITNGGGQEMSLSAKLLPIYVLFFATGLVAGFGLWAQPPARSAAGTTEAGLLERVARLEQEQAARTIAHLGQKGPVKVRAGWTSPVVRLKVRAGDLIRVSVDFHAATNVDNSNGFYWEVTASGPCGLASPDSNPARVLATHDGLSLAWHFQSTTALFRASADGELEFGIKVTSQDLSGVGRVSGLLMIAENLGRR